MFFLFIFFYLKATINIFPLIHFIILVLYHNGDVADALEAVVHSSVRHLHQHFLNRFAMVLRVHTLGGAEFLGDVEFLRVDVHADDPGGSGGFAPHDGGKTDGS